MCAHSRGSAAEMWLLGSRDVDSWSFTGGLCHNLASFFTVLQCLLSLCRALLLPNASKHSYGAVFKDNF